MQYEHSLISETGILDANRPFAWWRHFTTTTRILQFAVFLCKLRPLFFTPQLKKVKTKWILLVVVKHRHRENGLLGLLLVKPRWHYKIEIWKEKTKRILVLVVKRRHRANGLFTITTGWNTQFWSFKVHIILRISFCLPIVRKCWT